MLQNRYGDRVFPVPARVRPVQAVRRELLRRDSRRQSRRALLFVLPAIAVIVLAVFVVPLVVPAQASDAAADSGVLYAGALFLVVLAVCLVVQWRADASLPRREQQLFRRLAGDPDPTAEQQALLALDAQSDFAFGGWNSSLDYAPAWRTLPPDVRQREEARTRPRFRLMPVFARPALRADLDRRFQLASASDVGLFVADALSDRSMSARFSAVLHGQEGERALGRLASLTGVPEWDLRELGEPADGLPPRLLWGADAQRVIGVIRMAYLAEHLDAEEAWAAIERAAAPARALFLDWDGYWSNVRVGVAFASDRLEAVQEFDSALSGLRASAWPAAHVPFPRGGAVPAWLPRFEVRQRGTDRDGS